jgi:sirohydrochlorin ferrochelatase
VRAILLIDHGSREDDANRVVEDVAALLREAHRGQIIVVAHMELAAPSIAEGVAQCVALGARELIAVPYFLGPGRHASRDVPRIVADAVAEHVGLRAQVSEPLGAHLKIAELIALRAGLAAE